MAGAQPTEMPLADPPQAQQAAGARVEEGRWVEAMSSDGRMTTAYLKMPGSRVLGLRGKAVVDHHISAILNVFLNTSKSTEWIRCETDGVVVDFLSRNGPIVTRNTHLYISQTQLPGPRGGVRDAEAQQARDLPVLRHALAAGGPGVPDGARGGGGQAGAHRGGQMYVRWLRNPTHTMDSRAKPAQPVPYNG